MANPTIDPAAMQEAARHMLGHYNKPGGYKAGSFTTTLITAFEKADPGNRFKLSLGFPEMAIAARLMSIGAEDELRDLAEGRIT